jgi:AcrR family transcriptional regulator
MSPRPYQLGKRQMQIDESRRRVLDAARDLLAEASTYTAFTVDAVARQAGVARATVYYQFGSKTGLLEALCDDLAESGQMGELQYAFANPDPYDALASFVTAFARFWAADRLVMRRLRALAALDPDVQAVIAARDNRRHHGLSVLIDRLTDGQPNLEADETTRVLHTLTSFETFDSLAGPDRDPTSAVPIVLQLTEAVLRPAPES